MKKTTVLAEESMLPCFMKNWSGFDCPGCGMQRAMLYLIQGDLKSSFMSYPALVPIIIMLLFLALHLLFRFRYGADILKWLFLFNAFLIASSYIYRIA